MDSAFYIIDQTGEIAITCNLINEITVVDVNKLAAGIYLLRAGEENQLFEILK